MDADGADLLDLERTQEELELLVGRALGAASTLEEVVDCARAAAAVGAPALLEQVAVRIATEVRAATAGSGAWEAELLYSKGDAWQQTGRHARLLAEAWSYVAPGLRRSDADAGGA